ncbi:MAG: hypothetical protein JKY37_33140 [Nannocystaceae bacterium]|nr:hypothetical protein [Nannocystaceae bacterium]
MVSVMLLTVSLMTVGLLAVRSSVRDVTHAGQLVARERALVAAQSALDLAAAQYITVTATELDAALQGYAPQAGACSDPLADCIPDPAVVATGQRNDLLSGGTVSCGGRPCMRQGAVVNLRAAAGVVVGWADVPLRQLIARGDPEARVSVWIRNNSADALGGGGSGSGSWTSDNDGRVVLTASARVRNTTVTIEQEVLLSFGFGPASLLPQSPDEGYGGGHNNDNSAVSVCADNYTAAAEVP